MVFLFGVGDTSHGRSYVYYDWKGEPFLILGKTSKNKYVPQTPVDSFVPSSFVGTLSYTSNYVPPSQRRTRYYPPRPYYKTLRTSLPEAKYYKSPPFFNRNGIIEYALPKTRYYTSPPSWSRQEPFGYHSSKWTDYSPSWTLLNRAYKRKYDPIELYISPSWRGRSKQFPTTTLVSDKRDNPPLTYLKPLSATLKKYGDPLAYSIEIKETKSRVPAYQPSQYLMAKQKTFRTSEEYASKRNFYSKRRQPIHEYLKSLYDAEHTRKLDYQNYASLGRLQGKSLWTTRSRMYRFGGPEN